MNLFMQKLIRKMKTVRCEILFQIYKKKRLQSSKVCDKEKTLSGV